MLKGSWGVLAEREFRLYFSGQVCTQLGNRIAPLALAFAVLDLPWATASTLGIVLAAQIVPQLLLLLITGALADRLNRRAVMIGSDIAQFGTQAATAALILSGHAQLWSLVALQGAYGAAAAFFNPASTGLVRQAVSAGRLQQANSLLGLTRSVNGLLGPLLATALFLAVEPAWGLAFDAMTFLASAAMITAMRTGSGRMQSRGKFTAELAEGWHEFRSRRWLWLLVIDASLYQAGVTAAVAVLGPSVVEASLGGATAWGLIVAGRSVGAIVAGTGLLRWRPRRPMFTGRLLLLADVPFLLLLALPANTWTLVLLAALSGAAGSGFGILWRTAMQEHVPERVLSRVAAYDWLGSLACAPLGLVLLGRLGVTVGIAATLVGVAVFHLLMTAIVIGVREVRTMTSGPPDQSAEPQVPAAQAKAEDEVATS